MNYTELYDQITDYMQEFSTQFTDNIPNFVKNAENRILHDVELPVFTKNVTTTMTISEKYVQLPADYISPREIAIIVSGSHQYLMQKDVSFIREACPTAATTGVPRFYAQFDNNTLLVGPTPDLAYQIEMHYFYAPASIVTSTTSWLGDNAGTLLLYGALVEAYTFNKGDPDLMALYDKQYMSALQRVKLLGAGKMRNDAYRTPMNQMARP